MGGSFACPECGNSLELEGQVAGRVIRCGWCRTMVEVPFLPRADRGRRERGGPSRSRGAAWAWAAIAILAAAVLVLGTLVAVVYRARSLDARALTALTESAEEAEREGRFDRARADIEAALALARRIERGRPARLADLRRRRDRIVMAEARADFEALDTGGPSQALERGLALLVRVGDDPALAPLEPALRERLDDLRRRGVEADALEARQALAAGRSAEALDLCERLHRLAEGLPEPERRRRQAEADGLATRIVAHGGVVVAPIRGHFTLGSADDYAQALRSTLSEVLRQHGFVPRPPSSPWRSLWDGGVPFLLSIEVNERYGARYLQSDNRTSLLEARVTLSRGEEPIVQFPFGARTNAPLRGQSAFQASRLEVDGRQVPSFEHVLYLDARGRFLEGLKGRLRNLPRLDPPAAQDLGTPPPSNPGPAAGRTPPTS